MIIFLLLTQVDSLSLEQAIDLALAKSPYYHESKLSFEKSRIQFYQTLSNLLPTVSSKLSYTKSEYNGVTTGAYSGSMSLTQPIFDLDIFSSVIIAQRQLKSNRIQFQADAAELILKLKTAYFNLVNAEALLNSSKIALKRAEENLKLIEAKYELGGASRLEKLQGEVFHLRAQQDLAKAKTLQITAQEELKSLLGVSCDIYPTDTLTVPIDTEFPPLDSLVSLLQRVNYTLKIARELRNVAHLNLTASYLGFLPKVSFFYGYTYNSDSLIFDFQHFKDNTTKNYGVTFSFPIFELKSLIFNCLNARKELQLQEFKKQRALFETEKSLRTTYYTLKEVYEKLRLTKKSLAAAEEAAEIAKEQYALGVISSLDFLSAEKDLYDARVSYTSALSDFYIQKAKLSYLLGEMTFNEEK